MGKDTKKTLNEFLTQNLEAKNIAEIVIDDKSVFAFLVKKESFTHKGNTLYSYCINAIFKEKEFKVNFVGEDVGSYKLLETLSDVNQSYIVIQHTPFINPITNELIDSYTYKLISFDGDIVDECKMKAKQRSDSSILSAFAKRMK